MTESDKVHPAFEQLRTGMLDWFIPLLGLFFFSLGHIGENINIANVRGWQYFSLSSEYYWIFGTLLILIILGRMAVTRMDNHYRGDGLTGSILLWGSVGLIVSFIFWWFSIIMGLHAARNLPGVAYGLSGVMFNLHVYLSLRAGVRVTPFLRNMAVLGFVLTLAKTL